MSDVLSFVLNILHFLLSQELGTSMRQSALLSRSSARKKLLTQLLTMTVMTKKFKPTRSKTHQGVEWKREMVGVSREILRPAKRSPCQEAKGREKEREKTQLTSEQAFYISHHKYPS
jgi:hypothetical protein